MNSEILEFIKPLFGKKCCRVRVGLLKSLSLGFGKKIFHNKTRLNDTYYGEWEIETFCCSWRILKGDRIICASNDGDEKDLDEDIHKIEIGAITEIIKLNDIDVRVKFDNGVQIDFLATTSDYDDNIFHIFCPEHYYVGLTLAGKWIKQKSNEPHDPVAAAGIPK